MSKRESLIRQRLIVHKLRKIPATFRDIKDMLATESKLQDYNLTVSQRTFRRDLDDIRSLYNIDINFDNSQKVYFIEPGEWAEAREWMMEAFDVMNALHIADRLSDHIHFESRKSLGTENLYGLLHAIKRKRQIAFEYRKHWIEAGKTHHLEPYALKEYRNRWYVVGLDLGDEQIKTFGLDRLHDLEISKKPFSKPKKFDANDHYRHCFGIVHPPNLEPREVVLSFDPWQGKYIKSLPLHQSQEILVDDDSELRIRIKVFLTPDFIMEVLSYGDQVRVLEPKGFQDEIKDVLGKGITKYLTS